MAALWKRRSATKTRRCLIEINTPGGLLESTREIIEKILAAPVPVIIYVTPSGSRAASAGFFILESADVAAMAPGTNTGAAHPVTIGGGKIDDVMKEKMENDAAALMRSVAAKRGRNVEIAESAVRQSKSFTEQEALSDKLIDYVAPSEEDLFKQMQGKTGKAVRRPDHHSEPCRATDSAVRHDPETAHSGLHPRSEYCVYLAGDRRSGALCGIQPSGRGRALERWAWSSFCSPCLR